MIIVTGAIHTDSASHGPMLAACLEHCRRSRNEPGCIAHNVHVDCEDPCRLVFVEFWQDEPSLRAHFVVPETRAFAAYARDNAAETPEIVVHEARTMQLG
jgi:quinol monooxygenase YgiN